MKKYPFLLIAVSAPLSAQEPLEAAKRLAMTAQIQGYQEACPFLSPLQIETVRVVEADAMAGLTPSDLAMAAIQQRSARTEASKFPCIGADSDRAKNNIRDTLAAPGQFWAMQALVYAELQMSRFPHLGNVKGSNLPTSLPALKLGPAALEANNPALAADFRRAAQEQLTLVAGQACAQLSGTGCGPTPAAAQAARALKHLEIVNKFGTTIGQTVVSNAAAAAPSAPARIASATASVRQPAPAAASMQLGPITAPRCAAAATIRLKYSELAVNMWSFNLMSATRVKNAAGIESAQRRLAEERAEVATARKVLDAIPSKIYPQALEAEFERAPSNSLTAFVGQCAITPSK